MNGMKTVAMALAFGAAALLGACGENVAGQSKQAVRYEVGAAADYKGVKEPKLEAVYVQTPAEAQKYEPIMQEIRENGLGAKRKLQSGI